MTRNSNKLGMGLQVCFDRMYAEGVIASSAGLAMRSELPWVWAGKTPYPKRGYCRPETSWQ